jgi:hypothetical protein
MTNLSKLLRGLSVKPYKLELAQALKLGDLAAICELLAGIGNHNYWPARFIFSDEKTFHINGKLNSHNVRVWGAEYPDVTHEHKRDSPKEGVLCHFKGEVL